MKVYRTKVKEFIAKIMRIEKSLGSKIPICDWLPELSFPPEETDEILGRL